MTTTKEASATLVPGEKKPVTFYAEKIRLGWHKSLDGIFEAAKWAHEAHKALTPSQKKELLSAIPMHPSTLSRLSAVGRDGRLHTNDMKRHLPVNASAMTEITKLSDEELAKCLAAKVINPTATRDDIAGWRKIEEGGVPAPAKEKADARKKPGLLVGTVRADEQHYEQARSLLKNLPDPCKVAIAPNPQEALAKREMSFFRTEGKKAILTYLGVDSLSDRKAIEKAGWHPDDVSIGANASRRDVEQTLTFLDLHDELKRIVGDWEKQRTRSQPPPPSAAA